MQTAIQAIPQKHEQHGQFTKSHSHPMCLCQRCVDDYRDSGFILIKNGWQENMERCDFCRTGMGFEFIIKERGSRR